MTEAKEKHMKSLMTKFVIAFATSTLVLVSVFAQQGTATITADAEAAAGLDLHAVAELFKTSDNLEKFEQALNNPETGINNLDLDRDDKVDFIRVTERVADSTHLIILQTALGADEFQDVATIAVERESGAKYNLQLQGDASLYGANYFVVPATSDLGVWKVVGWLFRPNYRPYISNYSYRLLPGWWAVRRPLQLTAYRVRAGALVGRRNFVASRTTTVRTLNKLNYHPRSATLVVRKTNVTHTTKTAAPRGVVQTRIVTTTTARPATQTRTTTTQTRVIKPRKH